MRTDLVPGGVVVRGVASETRKKARPKSATVGRPTAQETFEQNPYPKHDTSRRWDLTPREVRPGWTEEHIDTLCRNTERVHVYRRSFSEKELFAVAQKKLRANLHHPNIHEAFESPIPGYRGYRPKSRATRELAGTTGAFSIAARDLSTGRGPEGMSEKLNPAEKRKGMIGGMVKEMMENTLAATGGALASPYLRRKVTARQKYQFNIGLRDTWPLSGPPVAMPL